MALSILSFIEQRPPPIDVKQYSLNCLVLLDANPTQFPRFDPDRTAQVKPYIYWKSRENPLSVAAFNKGMVASLTGYNLFPRETRFAQMLNRLFL